MTLLNIGQSLNQLWQAAQNAAPTSTTPTAKPETAEATQTPPAVIMDISGDTSSGSTGTTTMTKAEQDAAKKALEAQEKAAKEAAEAQAKAEKEALEAAEKAAKQAAKDAEDLAKAEAKAIKEAAEAAEKAEKEALEAAKKAAKEAEKSAGDRAETKGDTVAGPGGAIGRQGKDNGKPDSLKEGAAAANKASENSRASERAGPKEKGWNKVGAKAEAEVRTEATAAVRSEVVPEAEDVEVAVSRAAAERVQAKMMQDSVISLIGSTDTVGITLKPIETATTERASGSYAAAMPKPDAAEAKQRVSIAA